jgi:hypothetical protein
MLYGEVGIGRERQGDALAEKRVVVDQQGADRADGWFGHWYHPST